MLLSNNDFTDKKNVDDHWSHAAINTINKGEIIEVEDDDIMNDGDVIVTV